MVKLNKNTNFYCTQSLQIIQLDNIKIIKYHMISEEMGEDLSLSTCSPYKFLGFYESWMRHTNENNKNYKFITASPSIY